MNTWKDSFALDGKSAKWTYDMGVVLKGMEGLWLNTGNRTYFDYIERQMNFFVEENGSIKTYRPDEYNIDNINNGKLLLLLYRVTNKERYLKAAQLLRQQIASHPRTAEGGFWHKKIYPNQMWLDGLYMHAAFYAEYALLFNEDSSFTDIANQFAWMELHARDTKTGLLYHAWDESKKQHWANKETGCSPLFWARAMGWYSNALVDALDYFSASDPKRKILIAILNRLVNALEKQQDPNNGLWKDILNYYGPGKEKNYFEASASAQIVYAIAKGHRMGYLPEQKLHMAKRGYKGILDYFVKEEHGQTNLLGTVKVSGLGGNPYRDGSFEYYMSEPVIVNDPKGLGAFLLASNEMEMLSARKLGVGKNVLLDRYFNSEKRKEGTGAEQFWHYTWEVRSHPGFYLFGHLFKKYGASLSSLDMAPSASNLRKADVYIIVDPDHPKDNPAPNYLNTDHVTTIRSWVRRGGTLLLMANDSGNCDLVHFNELAESFGLRFSNKSINMVKNDQFEQGAVLTGEKHPIFRKARKIYLKEISVLQAKGTIYHLLKKENDGVMAIVKYGKGWVFAVGDPWLYNEYVDGRKLPADFQNHLAAEDQVQWLLTKNTLK